MGGYPPTETDTSFQGQQDTNETEDGRHYPTLNVRQRNLHSARRTNLADHQKGDTTSREGVTLLLNTRMTTLLHHQPVHTTQKTRAKLQTHRNEAQ
jgi:hypothetical protein